MADLNAGRPVIGLIEEFNDMVERIFPTRFNDMGNARGMQNGSTAPFTNRAR
jgi:hypothetical protein